MNAGLIVFIIFMWAFFGFLLQAVAVYSVVGDEYKLLPWQLHKITYMNWFGCIFVSILFFILQPAIYILYVLYTGYVLFRRYLIWD